MSCNTSKCGAVCCTFITMHWPIRTDQIRLYFNLHGIECVNDNEGGLWLKIPLVCSNLNTKTKKCRNYKQRPNACRIYPQHESPFIPKQNCSKLSDN